MHRVPSPFSAMQKRPDFCRDASEDVKNDKQEMPKMECKRQGSVIAKRERLLYLPFACEGKRGNRTRLSGLSQPFLSLSHRVRKRHELDFPIRGFCAPVAVMQYMLTTVIAFWASISIPHLNTEIQ